MEYSLKIGRETVRDTKIEIGTKIEIETNTEIDTNTEIGTKQGCRNKDRENHRFPGKRRNLSPLEYAFILVPNRRKGNKKTPRKWRSLFVQFTATCLQLCKSEKSYGKRC